MLGIGYWCALLTIGKTPALMLQAMPIAAGAAFVVLLVAWLVAMQRHHWPAAES